MSTSKYPLDFTRLRKGDVIHGQELQQIVGFVPGHPRWNLALAGLCEAILKNARLICCVQKDTVKVLTDEEADRYTMQEVNRAKRKVFRHTRNRALIDRTTLSDAEKARAETHDLIALNMTQHLRRAEKEKRDMAKLRSTFGRDAVRIQ